MFILTDTKTFQKSLYTPDKSGHNFGNKVAGERLLSCPRPLSTKTTGIPKTK
jgi:hypothetical protein